MRRQGQAPAPTFGRGMSQRCCGIMPPSMPWPSHDWGRFHGNWEMSSLPGDWLDEFDAHPPMANAHAPAKTSSAPRHPVRWDRRDLISSK
jgi:hypothetical protein